MLTGCFAVSPSADEWPPTRGRAVGVEFGRERPNQDGLDDAIDTDYHVGLAIRDGRQAEMGSVRGVIHRLDTP